MMIECFRTKLYQLSQSAAAHMLTKVGRGLTVVILALWCATVALWVTPHVAFAQTDIIFTAPDLTVAATDVTVTVPISVSTPADVALSGFRVELAYDATKLSVASCTVLVDLGACNFSTAGTIIFNGLIVSSFTDGPIVSIVFTVENGASGTSPLAMSLSSILDATPTDVTDRATAQDGSITFSGGTGDDEAGNCNSDGQVDAGDIAALILEIFDEDGSQSGGAGGGTFAGSENCDANRDTVIDAGDITCLILLIFSGPDACNTTVNSAASLAPAQLVPAQLRVSSQHAVDAGDAMRVAVTLAPENHRVTAAVFVLNFDPQRVSINPTDADADGIPDVIILHTATGQTALATVDEVRGRLAIAIFNDTVAAPNPLSDSLAEIILTAKDTAAHATGPSVLTLTESSLGDENGVSVPLRVHPGYVQIGEEMELQQLYLPFITNRD